MATLKELGVALTSATNARNMGVIVTPQLTDKLTAISNQSIALNGVGQFEGQPQSSLYGRKVEITPATLNFTKKIDKNRILFGISGSQSLRFSSATVAMVSEVMGQSRI